MRTLLNYIDGTFLPAASGDLLETSEPATGQMHATLPRSSGEDLSRGVEAARHAHPAWSAAPTAHRAGILEAIADLIDANAQDLAHAESIDTGKPIALATALDIPRAAANLRFFAGLAQEMGDDVITTGDQAVNVIHHHPVGIVGTISPWNLPLYILTWKIAPALMTGNCVIAKPSEVTPFTAFLFSELCEHAGLPPGVLNVIHGSGQEIGEAIVDHPDIGAISFTGGGVTGARIASVAAPHLKKVGLELGGKNPTIICQDADLDLAASTAVRAAFANQGQVCLCGERLLVHASIHDEFLDRFLAQTAALTIGDPLLEETQQGSLVSETHLQKVARFIENATNDGGDILMGGQRPMHLPERCCGGAFLEPTVLAGLSPSSPTNQTEAFGPVTAILPFDEDEEAIAIANGTEYGLSASIMTTSSTRAEFMAPRIQAGTVWVNCWMIRELRAPFGGMKRSGVGREGGMEAMRFYTEPQTVCTAHGALPTTPSTATAQEISS